MLFEKPYYYKHSIMPGYNVWENETYRLRACTGVASSIRGEGGIFIYSYSQIVKTINFKRN